MQRKKGRLEGKRSSFWTLLSLFLVLLFLLGGQMAWAGNLRRIVVFQEGTPEEVQEQIIAASGSRLLAHISLVDAVVIRLPRGGEEAALASLQSSPEVVEIETDASIAAQALSGGIQGSFITPVDPAEVAAGYPWNLEQIVLNRLSPDGHKGQGIHIGILDTGVDLSHPAFVEPTNYLYNARAGEDPQDWVDRNGHGTHIAGIIAASLQDPYFRGIAPRAKLHVIKVLDDAGGGYLSDLIQGLTRLLKFARNHPAERIVLNMSLGFSTDSFLLHRVVRLLDAEGVVMVAAAGNYDTTGASGEGAAGEGAAGEGAAGEGAAGTGCASGEGAAGEGAAGEGAASGGGCTALEQVKYPARYPETIAVGATDISARIAPYSIRGVEVDVVAPGGTHTDPIFSTDLLGGYGWGSGTSQAAAHVSGVVALMLQVNPDLTPQEVRQILQETAIDLGEPWEAQGAGLINAVRAVRQAGRW
ncbi:MAG: hypothetical protein D6736_18705 [Nitrospinota bacterium]|nr:MAG: hypothetical protein D6736_18705 [Nitrospinota bacterium]